jgi:hypothetical protein
VAGAPAVASAMDGRVTSVRPRVRCAQSQGRFDPLAGAGGTRSRGAAAYHNPDDFTCQTQHRRAAGRRELQGLRRTKREKLAPFTTLGASYDGNGS